MALGAMAMASLANAEGLTLEAKTFTEPVEEKLGPAIPVVVGFLAAVVRDRLADPLDHEAGQPREVGVGLARWLGAAVAVALVAVAAFAVAPSSASALVGEGVVLNPGKTDLTGPAKTIIEKPTFLPDNVGEAAAYGGAEEASGAARGLRGSGRSACARCGRATRLARVSGSALRFVT